LAIAGISDFPMAQICGIGAAAVVYFWVKNLAETDRRFLA
jgi:hypothetical protein